MILEFLLSLIVLYAILDWFHKRPISATFEKAKIRGPMPLPIIGNIHNIIHANPENMLDIFSNMRHKYGKIFRMFILHEHKVIITDPKDAEVILSSNKYIIKDSIYEIAKRWLGTGLLLSDGKKWFARRKVITPTFHFKILDQFVEVFDKNSTILAKNLEKRADGKTSFNVMPDLCLAALDIIVETAMGTEVNAQLGVNNTYTQAINDFTKILSHRLVKSWLRREWIFGLLEPSMKKTHDKLIKTLHEFTDNVIKKRRQQLHESVEENFTDDEFGCKRKMAFLDVLLQSTIDGKPLSDLDIREEVDTFMFAGHDTTTSGISFILYCISRHPKVHKKVFQEILDVFGNDKEAPATMTTLQELKYLDCVIKESLRMYPPVPFIGRYIPESIELNGRTMPPNTDYGFSIATMMRDENYFPEPNLFKPERFLDEVNHPYAYVPFSAGPRNCVGQKFAMLEMKSIISKLIRFYELLPLGEDAKPSMTIIMRSANGVNLGLRKRVY